MKYIKYMFPFVAVMAILAGCGDSDVYEEQKDVEQVEENNA